MRIFGEDLSIKKGDNAQKNGKPAKASEESKTEAVAKDDKAEAATEEVNGAETVGEAAKPGAPEEPTTTEA